MAAVGETAAHAIGLRERERERKAAERRLRERRLRGCGREAAAGVRGRRVHVNLGLQVSGPNKKE
jgi:hypothetical protein